MDLKWIFSNGQMLFYANVTLSDITKAVTNIVQKPSKVLIVFRIKICSKMIASGRLTVSSYGLAD